jgi:very-short-patch-repair endonuclease
MGEVLTIRRAAAVARARDFRRKDTDAEARLLVEVDGGQHADQAAYDERRTLYLSRSGLRVLRFWNLEILTNRDGVCLTILDACGGERPEGPRGKA